MGLKVKMAEATHPSPVQQNAPVWHPTFTVFLQGFCNTSRCLNNEKLWTHRLVMTGKSFQTFQTCFELSQAVHENLDKNYARKNFFHETGSNVRTKIFQS